MYRTRNLERDSESSSRSDKTAYPPFCDIVEPDLPCISLPIITATSHAQVDLASHAARVAAVGALGHTGAVQAGGLARAGRAGSAGPGYDAFAQLAAGDRRAASGATGSWSCNVSLYSS